MCERLDYIRITKQKTPKSIIYKNKYINNRINNNSNRINNNSDKAKNIQSS